MGKMPEATLPVVAENTRGKKEGSLLTRMSKLMKENPNIRYCRRGMVEILFPNIRHREGRETPEWVKQYWNVAKMFQVMHEDGQVATTKVGVTTYYSWVGG
jgi:hypothetical protein